MGHQTLALPHSASATTPLYCSIQPSSQQRAPFRARLHTPALTPATVYCAHRAARRTSPRLPALCLALPPLYLTPVAALRACGHLTAPLPPACCITNACTLRWLLHHNLSHISAPCWVPLMGVGLISICFARLLIHSAMSLLSLPATPACARALRRYLPTPILPPPRHSMQPY